MNQATADRLALIEFFRGDGFSRFGHEGDLRGLSPVNCAIHNLREFDALLKTEAGHKALIAMLHQRLIDQGLVPA